jgi:transposase
MPLYSVTAVANTDHDYHIKAELILTPAYCQLCYSEKIVGFGRREQLIKDLPVHGKRAGIYLNTRRIKCHSCNQTFSEFLPDVNEKRFITQRLLNWIGKQAVKRTFSSIAEEVGIAEGTVRLVFKDYVSEVEKTVRFETPNWMGVNEVH